MRGDQTIGLGLDEQLCFALYAASRAVTVRYRPLLDELALTYPQYLVMLALWQHGPLSVRGLGAELQLDSGTLSPLLKRLEAAGLVLRERSALDERSVVVTPTEAGMALREQAAAIPPVIAASTGLDLDELERLRESLRTLAARVQPDG